MSNKYIDHPAVQAAVDRIRQHCKGKQFSDIVDGEGHQYVDLVMEGGGVLGVALTGYTYALEQAGLRFLGVGGASAGAINACLLAAAGTPQEPRSARLAEILARVPMASFVDGDSDARDFSYAVAEKARLSKLVFKGAQVVDNLVDDLGLNPGERFFRWVSTELEALGVRTTAELMRRVTTLPAGLKSRDGEALGAAQACPMLALIAADVTTETKVEFPRMAVLYWRDPDAVHPACYVRASMSIPFFFHPYRVANVPQDQPERWRELSMYAGTPPREAVFMDGGIMSNFPINVFHEPNVVPRAPTFGAKLGSARAQPYEIRKPSQLLSKVFTAARHTLDNDFIAHNPDYRQLITYIDTGEHNWLDFNLDDAARIDLFRRGVEAGARFLCGGGGQKGFDWEGYKAIRRGIAEAYHAAQG